MKYHLNSRQEVEDFVRNEVLSSSETMEILGITRARLSQLVKADKLIPIKQLDKGNLFLRSDVEEKKKELEVLREKYQPYNQ
jgi:predicted XRE-type DNA-binding protein